MASYPAMAVASWPVPNRIDELEAALATSHRKVGDDDPRSVVRYT